MGGHSEVASARGATVVTGVQRADCREHSVSHNPDSTALQLIQQHPVLAAATSTTTFK